jgi:hypothetical protein
MTIHTHQHTGRFSEGMEQVPPFPASARRGSFADGMGVVTPVRVGCFADGQSLRPDAPSARRTGSFGDVAPPARTVRSRRRLRVVRGRARPQTA